MHFTLRWREGATINLFTKSLTVPASVEDTTSHISCHIIEIRLLSNNNGPLGSRCLIHDVMCSSQAPTIYTAADTAICSGIADLLCYNKSLWALQVHWLLSGLQVRKQPLITSTSLLPTPSSGLSCSHLFKPQVLCPPFPPRHWMVPLLCACNIPVIPVPIQRLPTNHWFCDMHKWATKEKRTRLISKGPQN